MDELMRNTMQLVRDNLGYDVSDNILQILSVSVLSIMLANQELVLEKLPAILKNLNVFFDNKSILELAHEKLGNYSEDDILKEADAVITRSIEIDDENNDIFERRTLLISLEGDFSNSLSIVSRCSHELTHLLRFGNIIKNKNFLIINDGIAKAYFDINSGTISRKHMVLEEGVTQRFTNRALTLLKRELNDYKGDSRLLCTLRKQFTSYNMDDYFIPVSIIDSLCKNKLFEEKLESTYMDTNSSRDLISYYNSVMGSVDSFLNLSKTTEALFSSFENKDINQANSLAHLANINISLFLKNACTRKFYNKPR